MIKGRYVATLVIDINFDDNQPGIRPFDDIKKDFYGSTIDEEIVAAISELFGEECPVGLTRQYSDLYKTEDTDGGSN